MVQNEGFFHLEHRVVSMSFLEEWHSTLLNHLKLLGKSLGCVFCISSYFRAGDPLAVLSVNVDVVLVVVAVVVVVVVVVVVGGGGGGGRSGGHVVVTWLGLLWLLLLLLLLLLL